MIRSGSSIRTFTSNKRVLGEVGIAVLELGAGTIKGGKDPLVGIVKCAVVVVEVLIVDIRASRAIVKHLIPCFSAEARDSAAVVVVVHRVVSVWVLGSIDLNGTTSSEAANRVFELCARKGKGTDLALYVRALLNEHTYV